MEEPAAKKRPAAASKAEKATWLEENFAGQLESGNWKCMACDREFEELNKFMNHMRHQCKSFFLATFQTPEKASKGFSIKIPWENPCAHLGKSLCNCGL